MCCPPKISNCSSPISILQTKSHDILFLLSSVLIFYYPLIQPGDLQVLTFCFIELTIHATIPVIGGNYRKTSSFICRFIFYTRNSIGASFNFVYYTKLTQFSVIRSVDYSINSSWKLDSQVPITCVWHHMILVSN